MNNVDISVGTFDKLAKRYQDKYMDFCFYQPTYDKLIELMSSSRARVLDLACGPANISCYLHKKLPQLAIHGVDLAPNMIALAKENLPSATFEVLDTRNVAQLAGEFDLVVAGFATPYLSELEVAELLVDLRLKLAKGGLLYLSTMEALNKDDQLARTGMQTSSAGDQVYIYYHLAKFLKACLSQSGFEIIAEQRLTMDVAGANNGTAANDLFIYAKAI